MAKVYNLVETIVGWPLKTRVYFALLTLFFLFSQYTEAHPLKGKVVDANGNPLIGATIRVNNSKEGTVADAEGNFNLQLTSNKLPVILTINYLGYEKQEVKVMSNKSNLGTIKLHEDGYSLNDVVVVGYGQQSRKKLTGAVSKVKGDVVSEATQDAPIMALQGTASGVYVAQASGVPGGGSTSMVIRGASTLSSDQEPLYIVDGVPLNSNPENPIAYTSTGLLGLPDELSLINPNDIESIEVLKDADATAIYGTRGSKGVVLITTKKGREGRVKVNLKMSTTAQFMSKRLDFLNTEEYTALRRKAFEADKAKGYVTDADLTPAKFPDLTLWDQQTTYDWQDILFGNTAWGTDIQLNVSGGNKNTSFMISGGYYSSGTVTVGDDKYTRWTGRSNVQHQSDDHRLHLDAGISVTKLTMDADAAGAGYSAVASQPNLPPYDENGEPYWLLDNSNFDAPLSILNYSGTNDATSLNASFNGSYRLWDQLAAKVQMGYNYSSSNQQNLYPRSYYHPLSTTAYNQARYFTMTTSTLIVEPQLTYNCQLLGGKADFLLGATYQNGDTHTILLYGQKYPGDIFLKDANAASLINYHQNPSTQTKSASFFGRITYDWQDRYLLNATFRRDGSSRFGKNHRYGNFYSVGLGWLFSNEKFIKDNLKWLSYGKLRVSTGRTGNDGITDYQYMTKYATSQYPYEGSVGIVPSNLANDDLHWETTDKFDVGLELGFFNDRILFTANYYHNTSKDLLTRLYLPNQTGFSYMMSNLDAEIVNKGLELELNTQNIKTKDFRWTTQFTLTIPSNKLTKFKDLANSGYYNTYEIGKSVNIIRGYKYLGVDNQTGVPMVQDQNGDGKINSNDDYITLGSKDPKYYAGLQNTIKWKNLTFDFSLYYRNKPMEYGYLWRFYNPIGMSQNVTREMASNYWTTPGVDAKYPGLTTTSASDIYDAYYRYMSYSDAAFSTGSYLRLQNVRLAYDFDQKLVGRLGISALQLYVQGKNLLTITNYDAYDPETGDASVPPTQSVVFGLNVTF
ncbi:SusC/RagA family TonB-linked outer membrane protein [Prevotella sp. P6B1]|uniref:SusC/RagA family TonB-linked outer membrane protein n=1 Tax=Prevotella sp. P6B1 TaxID=1410613 RepID=UPI0009DF34E0|nr:SusC/RagA family TonB-linked outer membrane protein [Prevotella sp. P6B1]